MRWYNGTFSMTELQSKIVSLFAARDRVESAVLDGEPYTARQEFLSEAESVLASTSDPKTREIVTALKQDVEQIVLN